MRNYLLFVGSMVAVILLLSSISVVSVSGQDKFNSSKVNDTLLVKVVNIHSEDSDRDVVEGVDGAGELWGFYAVKGHTLEKGDYLYLTIEDGKCVAAMIQ